MKTHAIILASALALVGSSVSAKNEGELPAGARPATVEEIKGQYAGKTIDFKVAAYYMAPDGNLVGFSAQEQAFAEGTWRIEGNELCMDSLWRGEDTTAEPSAYRNCRTVFVADGKIWTTNTWPNDEYIGDTGTWEAKKLKKGDKVSRKAARLKAKFGY